MANQAAKKRKAENEAIMRRLQITLLGVNLFYFLIRILLYYSSFGYLHMIAYAGILGFSYFTYSWIAAQVFHFFLYFSPPFPFSHIISNISLKSCFIILLFLLFYCTVCTYSQYQHNFSLLFLFCFLISFF